MTPVMISVIIPVYNSEPYITRCVESVLSQSFSGEIEVLLIDDGSTDGSGKMCDELARNDDRISVFHTENRGASLARRLGLDKAKGEYVTFVDSDDYVAPNYVSTLFELLQRNNVNISACGVRRLKSSGELKPETIDGETMVLEKDALFRRFFKYEFWSFWGGMYLRKQLLDIDFPKSTLSEDYYVKARLFQKEQRMVYTSAPLYYYEHHENSLSHQRLSTKAFEEFDNVKGVYDFVVKEMPDYTDFAFSNVVETAVKLLRLSKNDLNGAFFVEKQMLQDYLNNHRKEIVFCSPLNKKVKILALWESVRYNLS